MNEWVMEIKDERMNCWRKSVYYSYSPLIGISSPKEWYVSKVCRWFDLSDKDKSRYRLRHTPTGKIIPGDLL